MTYTNLGLNDQLRSVDSPSKGTTVQALNFDSSYEIPPGYLVSGLNALNSSGELSLDAMGVISLNNFVQSDNVTSVFNQHISSTVAVDVTGASLSFVLNRPAVVAYNFFSNISLIQSGTTDVASQAVVNLCKNINGGVFSAIKDVRMLNLDVSEDATLTLSNHYVGTVPAGTTEVKLMGQLSGVTGTPYMDIYFSGLSYTILGK